MIKTARTFAISPNGDTLLQFKKGKAAFPGGKIEIIYNGIFGGIIEESPQKAARREFKEETGIILPRNLTRVLINYQEEFIIYGFLVYIPNFAGHFTKTNEGEIKKVSLDWFKEKKNKDSLIPSSQAIFEAAMAHMRAQQSALRSPNSSQRKPRAGLLF